MDSMPTVLQKGSTLFAAQAQALANRFYNSSYDFLNLENYPTHGSIIPHTDSRSIIGVIQEQKQKATPRNVAISIATILIVRTIGIIIYRLSFHPLSKFPGPKIAAVSRLYEFWYQGIKRTEFPEKIKQMHQKYGPIVRISPFELSLNDSDFNLEYFLKDRKLEKDPWYYGLGFTESLFTLKDKEKHRQRQAHLASHFSGTHFATAAPIVGQEISALCGAFEESAATGKSLNLSLAYRKMGNDILRRFLLGERGEKTAPKDYMKDAPVDYHPIFKTMTYVRHFPVLYRIHAFVPSWVYERWLPLAKYQRDADDHVRYLINDNDKNPGANSGDDALLYHFVEKDPSYRENNASAAVEEFTALQWGGREVLGHGLTNISYHLMANPECMQNLYAELQTADFDITTASYAQLSSLTYLRAVCKEGLRMQLGGGFRIPRTNPQPVVYKQWVIPANTPVSMCPKFFHDDETHFPEHLTYKPDRWLNGNEEELDKYFKPFGNGSRSCIGMNLALEVVFRVIANVFSKYRTELQDIDEEFCWKDGMLKVFPHAESHGLTITAKAY